MPALEANRKHFHFHKGETIFCEGDEVKGMFFVNTGLVKVHKKWGEEKELILRFAKDGDIFGHRGLGNDTIYPVSATALTPTDVCYIDLPFFETTLKVNTEFLYHLMMFFASELKESEKRMRNLAHMPVRGRIANALLTLHKKFGTDDKGNIDIIISRQDLASYTGTVYETLFRSMNEMAEEKLIEFNGKKIKILKEQKLSKITLENR
ncbi:MAG: Crp/Fnr family transcriptional regulator [Lacibacter sp.]